MFLNVCFQNVSVPTAGMYSMQLISLDAILMLVAGMDIRCKGKSCKPSRHEASPNLPTREDLLATKANKRVGARPCLVSAVILR